jgi:Flp pilus assembly protein TadG
MNNSVSLKSRGQSLTEVAFFLPLLLLLILGAVDVARVLSAQQRLDQAAYVAALRLGSTPSLRTDLGGFILKESGLSVTTPATLTAGTTYSVGADGSDQVAVTATYKYPLLLPGLDKLLGDGTWPISVSRASVATTDPPPTVTDLFGAVVKVATPSGTTVPSGLALTCTLYRNGTPVPTPAPAPPQPCMWSPGFTGTTYTYTATVMQVNGITSPPSTPRTGY